MMSLLHFCRTASILLACLLQLVDADAPAPQPADPSSAACQFDVGYGLYDLSPLNKLGKQVLPTSAGTLYLSPCTPIRAADCAALCCLNTDGGRWASCGFTQGQGGPLVGAEFNGVDGFQVKLTGEKCHGSVPYVAFVHYLCDQGASGQNAGTADVDPADPCTLQIRWPSASACSQRPTDKGSYSPALWHLKFIAAYFGAALVYFAGGYIYNYKVYGLSGREAFPHSQFWFVDLHGLVTDGCYFSLDLAKALHARLHKCCTGQDMPDTSEYAYSRAPTFEADVDQD